MINTIMITGIGTSTSQNIVKAIKEKDKNIKFIGLDMDSFNSGRFIVDKFDLVPAAKSPNYIQTLTNHINKYKPDLLFPIVDYEIMALAGIDDINGTKIMLPSRDTLILCDDKEATIECFKKNGLLSPEIIEANNNIWPKMVRPRLEGRASIGAARVNNIDEWKSAASKLERPITTEFKIGQEVTVDILCDDNSNVIAYAPRERVDIKSGVAYKSLVYHDPQLDLDISTICKSFGLKYLNCIQAIRVLNTHNNANNNYWTNEYWWFEVNPRFGGGSAATVISGLNLPSLLLKYLDGEEVLESEKEYNDGFSVRALKEYFIANKTSSS